jgi:hypothetical protein
VTERTPSERGFSKLLAIFFLSIAAIVVAILFFGGNLRRFVREFLMQSVTSSHYEILCPPGALSQSAMKEFAIQREPLFTALDKKLHDVDSNVEIRIIFDPDLRGMPQFDSAQTSVYLVSGTTIRATLNGKNPQLPAAFDAEALLNAAWGKPGNSEIAEWAANWLVGEWHGMEIGMAAAQVEQKLGHKKLASVLGEAPGENSYTEDQDLLGAAWISEIAEFGGADAVRTLYATKMTHPNVVEVAKVLGTTPLELDRKWQLWMYAYLAGMPSMPRDSGMPMNMPMAGSH